MTSRAPRGYSSVSPYLIVENVEQELEFLRRVFEAGDDPPEDQSRETQVKRFNPRTRTGCDLDQSGGCPEPLARFNPRTRTGCDSTDIDSSVTHTGFQSTHPYGVRRPRRTGCSSSDCFNPRTRTGCDLLGVLAQDNKDVSIHAPVRGATTPISFLLAAMVTFQSTHPYGVRLVLTSAIAWGICVSIHAPVRGATRSAIGIRRPKCGFNPRTRTGCDGAPVAAHPEDTGFNPRTRTGCDASPHRVVLAGFVFQSTHPYGVRRFITKRTRSAQMFQSTHPYGVRRHSHKHNGEDHMVSIHAPVRGATHWPLFKACHL